MNVRRIGCVMAITLLCAGVSFAELTVDSVEVRQNRPWSPDIVVDYHLTGEGEVVDVEVAAFNGSLPLTLPAGALSGERYALASGDHRLRIDPIKAFGKGNGYLGNFRVSLTAVPASDRSKEVLYKIFDLEGPSHTVTDVTRGALLNGTYGAIETDYSRIGEGYQSPLKDVLIWTGVTNYPGVKTTKLVMRKIPAGPFKFNRQCDWTLSTIWDMSISQDYYIGVFEVTKKQYSLMNPAHTDDNYCKPQYPGDELPMENLGILVCLFDLNKDVVRTTADPAATSALGGLRAKFGGAVPFTLPTQAQWYRAMRAESETYYYDGIAETPEDVDSSARADFLGLTGTEGGVEVVGRRRPNAFGLYDMLGNVAEATLDAGNYWNNPSTTVDLLNGEGKGIAFGTMGRSFAMSAKLWDRDVNLNRQLHSTNKSPDVGFRLAFWVKNPYETEAN